MPCPYCNSREGTMLSDTEIVCNDCGKGDVTANWGTAPKRDRNTYEEGSHGAKGREQKRLKTSGATHQSEHVVGYDVFAHGAKRGKSDFAKKIENIAPAYQEDYDSHRGHIGTSNHNNYRNTGESSNDYRKHQRRLVKQKAVGAAVQLNQLHYSHQSEFRTTKPKQMANLKKADDSFAMMVENFAPIPLWNHEERELQMISVTASEKAEMNLSRMTARGGSYPSRKDELEAMKKLGIIASAREKPVKKSPALIFSDDIWGIPKDGNCLFHSIWWGLNAIRDNLGFVSNQTLREQAVGFLRTDRELHDLGAVDAEYLSDMATNGAWAGELEAMALAHVWGVCITIIGPNYRIAYNANATSGFCIYYNGSHYSIGPLDD